MRRMILAVLAVALVAAPATAGHGTQNFVETGTILVGNPATRVIGGVTENVSPCNGSIDEDVPDGASNGVDAQWVNLPAGAAGHAATLTSTEGNDVDAWFYDSGCNLIKPPVEHAYSMASVELEANGDESGTIPAGAAYAAITLWEGALAPFTFTIVGAAPSS